MIPILPRLLVNGLLVGGLYGLLSMGLTLQYNVGRVLNIAHGEFVMLGALLTWQLRVSYGISPLVAMAIIAPIMFVIGFLIQATLFRFLRARTPTPGAFESSALLVAFGIFYIIQNIASLEFGGRVRTAYYLNYTVNFLGMPVIANRLLIFAVAIAVGVAFYLIWTRTRPGRAMRATAENPSTASLMGVNVNIIMPVCFGLGAAIAGAVGSMISMYSAIHPGMGFRFTLISLVVVVLGGLGSIPGSFIAGITIGIVSSLVSNYLSPSLVIPFYYGMLLIILLVRPQGILGKK